MIEFTEQVLGLMKAQINGNNKISEELRKSMDKITKLNRMNKKLAEDNQNMEIVAKIHK